MSAKSTITCWNVNSRSAGEIKGSLGWDGSIVLQMWHWDLVCLMLIFRHGQNNRCLAFASIPFTPCAAWSDSSTSTRSCRGIRILLALAVTPSKYGPENPNYGREVVAWFEEAVWDYVCFDPAFFISGRRGDNPFPRTRLQLGVTSVHRREGGFDCSVDNLDRDFVWGTCRISGGAVGC